VSFYFAPTHLRVRPQNAHCSSLHCLHMTAKRTSGRSKSLEGIGTPPRLTFADRVLDSTRCQSYILDFARFHRIAAKGSSQVRDCPTFGGHDWYDLGSYVDTLLVAERIHTSIRICSRKTYVAKGRSRNASGF
jgi:hypothetical protein